MNILVCLEMNTLILYKLIFLLTAILYMDCYWSNTFAIESIPFFLTQNNEILFTNS